MDDALEDELRALRARAYGRDADLAQDPAAVERLRELEALSAVAPSGVTAVQDGHEGSRDPDAPTVVETAVWEQPAPEEQTTVGKQPAPAEQEQTPLRTHRRRTAALIAGGIAVAVVASAVTWGIARIAPVATSSGTPQIATLVPSTEVSAPDGIPGVAPNSPVWEFHGLTMSLGTRGQLGDDGGECLWLWRENEPSSESEQSTGDRITGWGTSGCATGSFPATVVLPLPGDDLPPELLTAFPDGRAIQFVLDGDRVGVFLDSD